MRHLFIVLKVLISIMKKENLMGESATVLNAIEFRSSWGLFHIQPLKTQIKILDWTF